jgi:hypothetical protein
VPILACVRASEPRQSKDVLVGAALTLLLVLCVGRNLRSLREGLGYLRHKRAWDPGHVKPVDPHGAFGICHDLVHLGNAARGQAISARLRDLNLNPIPVPIPDEPHPNVLATLHAEGPYTLFVAHYDKSRETVDYQAASDNTAAVCALLAAARDLAAQAPRRPVAFLFSAAEERGCRGARAFLSWAKARGLDVAEVINFDMIGRGKLASRPSALPGFYFWLPGVGQVVYNGRGVARGRAYPSPDPGLIRQLKAVLGDDLVTYWRFTARSDSNIFQAAGLPTVSLSSDDMYYLDLVWERDADRLELLDEHNLDLARRLVVDYARRAA